MNSNKIIDILAKTVSGISFPILMPTYAVIMVFTCTYLWFMPARPLVTVTLVTLGLTAMLPIIAIYFLHYTGVISDPMLNERRDRTIPYALSAVCYGALAVYLNAINAPLWMVTYTIGAALLVLVMLPINLRWKISGHAAGAGGLTALSIFIVYMGYCRFEGLTLPCCIIALAGCVGTARLLLNRHTLSQVAAGFILGFVTLYLSLIIA